MKTELGTRSRLIATTAELLQTRGYQATGLNRILQGSSTAKGALYHHFPGGKEELAVHALAAGGAFVDQAIEQALASTDNLSEALHILAQAFAEQLQTSNYQKGCPIATTALEEAALNDHLQLACNKVFHAWQARTEQSLLQSGWEPTNATKMATFILAVLEGGLLLSRVERTTQPLEQVVDILAILLTQGEKK